MLYSVELRSRWSDNFNLPQTRKSDSDRIQTCNLLIRSQMLYSVELRNPLNILCKAVRTGLEPVTPCVTGMYSNQLN